MSKEDLEQRVEAFLQGGLSEDSDVDDLEEANPYHDADDGKFTSGDAVNKRNGGSWSLKGTKKKLKKGKKGQGPKKKPAPDPCGRDARAKGGNVRCWDGAIKTRVPKG